MLTRLGIPKLWGEDPERCWTFMRYTAAPIARWLSRGEGYGVERIPASGGGVVAMNHFSGIDPALVGALSRRTIYYMAKLELVSVPVLGELLRWTGTFAVRRGEGDRDSIRVARWLAGHGHLVGVFMEGTRQKLGHPGPAHPGAAMIAINEQVPVIPCGVDSFGWSIKKRRRCAVVWGDPIDLSGLPRNGRGYKEGAALLEVEINRLWRQAAQAAADGFPKQLPDGARRSRVHPWNFLSMRGLEPWPTEEWAAGPLGSVYRGP